MSTVNRAYPAGLAAILAVDVDLVSDTLSVQLVDEGFVFDSTDETLADVDAGVRVGPLTTVAGTRSTVGRSLVTDTAITSVPSVSASADEVAGVLLVGPGATDADRALICVWMRGADRTPIVVNPDGGAIEVEFLDGVILTLGG